MRPKGGSLAAVRVTRCKSVFVGSGWL